MTDSPTETYRCVAPQGVLFSASDRWPYDEERTLDVADPSTASRVARLLDTNRLVHVPGPPPATAKAAPKKAAAPKNPADAGTDQQEPA